MIGEYARRSAAAGGFDRSEAQLRRAVLRLDTRGFAQLSKACEKLLERVQRIEADAAKRIGREARAEDVIETGLGLLLFEAARLGTGSTHRRAPRPRRRSAPATGSVVAGAGTEG